MSGSAGLNPRKNKKLESTGLRWDIQNLLPEYEDLAVGLVVLIADNTYKNKAVFIKTVPLSKIGHQTTASSKKTPFCLLDVIFFGSLGWYLCYAVALLPSKIRQFFVNLVQCPYMKNLITITVIIIVLIVGFCAYKLFGNASKSDPTVQKTALEFMEKKESIVF